MDMSTIDPLVTDRLALAAKQRASRSSTRRSAGWRATPSAASRCSWSARTTRHSRASSRCSRRWARRSITAAASAPACARNSSTTIWRSSRAQLNAEAIALSQRFGLSLEKTLDVIHGTTATNGQLKIAWPPKVFKGDTEPGFTIDLAHKDLTLIVEAAQRREGADADRRRRA